jgi:serine/threonine-protein kinase
VKQDHERCRYDKAYLVTQEAYLSAQGDQMLGQEIGGRYGVIERLGMGGMGAVYKAVEPKSKQEVAVKVLRETYAKHPAIRERFIREAEAGAALDHPNVVPLIDFGIEEDGRLWLAMEFVAGWTLRDEINHNGAFTVSESIELMKQVLKGLAVAHDAGLIHRDLKHDNIMYSGRRERFIARIVDFGVVKSAAADLDRGRVAIYARMKEKKRGVVGQDQDGAFDLSEAFREETADDDAHDVSNTEEGLEKKALTAVGMMVGSPSYMAPEQIRGLKVGPPADLYALAVVAYEILAARRLFTVNDYETLLREGAQRDAPHLVFSARGELIPESLSEIIHTALAHDPTDRYPDAHTMLLALDQMKMGESVLPVNLFCELPLYREATGPSHADQSELLQRSDPEINLRPEHPLTSLHEDLSAQASLISEYTDPDQEERLMLSPSVSDRSDASSHFVSSRFVNILIWLTPLIIGFSAWFAARFFLTS